MLLTWSGAEVPVAWMRQVEEALALGLMAAKPSCDRAAMETGVCCVPAAPYTALPVLNKGKAHARVRVGCRLPCVCHVFMCAH
jgi:hypothetical protein